MKSIDFKNNIKKINASNKKENNRNGSVVIDLFRLRNRIQENAKVNINQANTAIKEMVMELLKNDNHIGYRRRRKIPNIYKNKYQSPSRENRGLIQTLNSPSNTDNPEQFEKEKTLIKIPLLEHFLNDPLGLNKVYGCNNPHREADIIFIHGLLGGTGTTWMSDKNDITTFWPYWLFEDFKNVGIWSLGYQTSIEGWNNESIPIEDRGVMILDYFRSNDIGIKPFYFISHSMGGIIVKQLIDECENGISKKNFNYLTKALKGIIFIATPHAGSGIANIVKLTNIIFRIPIKLSRDVDILNKHNEKLYKLHHKFVTFIANHPIAIDSYYETLNLQKKFFFNNIKFIFKSPFQVVDRLSANPQIPDKEPIPIENSDHITICKPIDRSSQIYLSIKKYFEENINNE